MSKDERIEKYNEKRKWGEYNLREVITMWKICFYVG
jgi:hypothetical protein